jgi:hypothetical protein
LIGLTYRINLAGMIFSSDIMTNSEVAGVCETA